MILEITPSMRFAKIKMNLRADTILKNLIVEYYLFLLILCLCFITTKFIIIKAQGVAYSWKSISFKTNLIFEKNVNVIQILLGKGKSLTSKWLEKALVLHHSARANWLEQIFKILVNKPKLGTEKLTVNTADQD